MSKEENWHLQEIICECDNCNNYYEYDMVEINYPDFKDCQEELRREGWISRKIDGFWYDFCCEECYRDFMKKRARREAKREFEQPAAPSNNQDEEETDW